MLFETLAAAGATQVEPGHGLTGTTALHIFEDLPERPAAVYLTEVSHHYGGKAYCFGGGLYIDPIFPAYDLKADTDLSVDPGFVKPGSDYSLKPGSALAAKAGRDKPYIGAYEPGT